MFEVLAGYLEVCVSPEQRKVCLDACNTLVEAGIDEHAFLIEQELAVADSLDSDAVLAIAQGLLISIYANQLSEFGVTLTEDATLAQHVDVFQALNQIDNYDDPETLQGYCDSPEGSQAALSDILSVLGAHPAPEEYLPILAYVSPRLLERITDICVRENVDELPDEGLVFRSRTRLAKLFATAAAQAVPELLIHKAVEDGARLASPMELLVRPYLSMLERCGPNQLGVELLAFACASNANDDGLLDSVRQQLPHFLTLDSQAITAIDVLVGKLIKQVTNA